MRCFHCGQELNDNQQYCTNCGANQGAGATVLLDQVYNPYAEQTAPQQPVYADPYAAPTMVAQFTGPRIQFPTNRGLLKMIFLGLITLGIYDVVVWCKMITELNVAACRYDGKRTMPYFAMVTLAPITLGILPIVWMHKLSNRIGDELNRRGLDYKFSASTFWLWNVLGSLILVGPFVYIHKLMKSMNMINEDFNQKG